MEPPKHSAIYQLNRISSLIGTDVFLLDFNQRVLLLNNQFVHNDEMVRKVTNLCALIGEDLAIVAFYRQILKDVLSHSYTDVPR